MQWGRSIQELSAEHLTGQSRHRAGWFGHLILQVEVRAPIPQGAVPLKAGEDIWARGETFYWRDASVEDLQTLLGRHDWKAGWMTLEAAKEIVRNSSGPPVAIGPFPPDRIG